MREHAQRGGRLRPSNGDVPLLAVDPAHRRQAVGRALLDAAATRCAKPLRILKIDDRIDSVNDFLAHCGATKSVAPLEMVIELSAASRRIGPCGGVRRPPRPAGMTLARGTPASSPAGAQASRLHPERGGEDAAWSAAETAALRYGEQ